jgi:hypothetical protein
VCFAMGASVSAAYEAVAEGLFNLVRGFAEEVFGVVGSAVGEVVGSFVLAVKKVVFLLGEGFATLGKGNVFPKEEWTRLKDGGVD